AAGSSMASSQRSSYVCVSDSCEFSLDPNSAQRRLLLSEDNRTVTRVKEDQNYSLHLDRFRDCYHQVLSSTGLRGRCYWEVEWRGDWVSIAMSYKTIKRRGDVCAFGHNNLSWSVEIDRGECFARYNQKRTKVYDWLSSSGGVSSDRVGVFLDSEAGVSLDVAVVSVRASGHSHRVTETQDTPGCDVPLGTHGFVTFS
uniref:B30.2/SPRY domain-containing protein n=1 Tax=Periophthalmus magnuspinnatus TaxID=409849 RepID=A0A3B4BKL5_9GOBI